MTTVTPESAGWRYSGLTVVELAPGGVHEWDTGQDEVLVLPLSGGCVVSCVDVDFRLAGRPDVFHGPADFAYLPTETHARIESAGGGRFALPSARAQRRLPARHHPADGVPVELRGTGHASREVHNLCTPETFDADRLMVVEVLTPGGNWSSYPPHKHDEHTDRERPLEEIYYFEIAGGGMGYQRVYGGGMDVLTEVRTGDVVLIPHGYHGPSMAPPGYHMYYLNVMAGPVREWLFTDDPAHAWIRDTWAGEPVDPRLPLRRSG
ncbi:MAG TPA: 5-deoxy-glucuronate isomerase [Pseudonocardiaceae bacterium]|nr:5-deoxy-glucuronate isomerase [Pseudonocardiaceae bacterium]